MRRQRFIMAIAIIALTGCASRPTAPPGSAAVAPVAPVEKTFRIRSEYDRFKGSTRVSVPLQQTLFGMTMNMSLVNIEVSYSFPGQTPTRPPAVFMTFDPSPKSANWRYLELHDVDFLVNDSVRINGVRTTHDGSVGKNFSGDVEISEWVIATLPLEQFLAIASARKVEGKVGITEFKLSPAQLATLRAFVAQMPSDTAG